MGTVRADGYDSKINVAGAAGDFLIDDVVVTPTAAELNAGMPAGATAGTVVASKGVVVDANKMVDTMGVATEITRAWNATGSTISKGALVSFVGVHTNGQPKIVLADANVANLHAQAAAQADILTASAGTVILRGLSPATLNTDSFSAVDDPVYLSETPGAYATAAETESDERNQIVGYVVVKSATVGQYVYDFTKQKALGSESLQDGAVTTAKVADDGVTNAKLGPQVLKTYRFHYVFGTHGGAQGAITLTATNGQLPDNFVIQSAIYEAVTALQSGGTAALQLGITGNADLFNDDNHDAGPYAGGDGTAVSVADEIPIKLTAATDVILTVGTADLTTAGEFYLWVSGFEGA